MLLRVTVHPNSDQHCLFLLLLCTPNSSISPPPPRSWKTDFFGTPTNFHWPTSNPHSRLVYFFTFLACSTQHPSKLTYTAVEITLEMSQAPLACPGLPSSGPQAEHYRGTGSLAWPQAKPPGPGQSQTAGLETHTHAFSYTHSTQKATQRSAIPRSPWRNFETLARPLSFRVNAHCIRVEGHYPSHSQILTWVLLLDIDAQRSMAEFVDAIYIMGSDRRTGLGGGGGHSGCQG